MSAMSALDAVDGSSTGTEVPWMWVLLRPPRFGGVKHASGYDDRSRHREVGLSKSRNAVPPGRVGWLKKAARPSEKSAVESDLTNHSRKL
jgi:hypothetical protein